MIRAISNVKVGFFFRFYRIRPGFSLNFSVIFLPFVSFLCFSFSFIFQLQDINLVSCECVSDFSDKICHAIHIQRAAPGIERDRIVGKRSRNIFRYIHLGGLLALDSTTATKRNIKIHMNIYIFSISKKILINKFLVLLYSSLDLWVYDGWFSLAGMAPKKVEFALDAFQPPLACCCIVSNVP